MTSNSHLVREALGYVTPTIEKTGQGDRLYAYFEGCEVSMVTNEHPMYPTKRVVEVDAKKLNDVYIIIRARAFDTSKPEVGDWRCL